MNAIFDLMTLAPYWANKSKWWSSRWTWWNRAVSKYINPQKFATPWYKKKRFQQNYQELTKYAGKKYKI